MYIIEEERAWLTRARREVESQAKKMMMQGLELMVCSTVYQMIVVLKVQLISIESEPGGRGTAGVPQPHPTPVLTPHNSHRLQRGHTA